MLIILKTGSQQKPISMKKIFFIENITDKLNFQNNDIKNLFFPCFFFLKKETIYFKNCWVLCKLIKKSLKKKIVCIKFKRRKNYRKKFSYRIKSLVLKPLALIEKI